ncbi:MAG: hypothetical protein IK088_00295 [Lachnospiraceae bacterium]|nr:hypothetical protein [Lachnospiraceae bacterium]
MKTAGKIISLLLSLLLIVSLCACNVQKDPTPSEDYKGETVYPLPDENGDGNPDVPVNCMAVIYLSINPEIALFIDGQERVIGVEYLNEDARTAYGDLRLGGIPYSECTGRIVEAAIEKQYLKADGKVSVEVSVLSEEIESEKISRAVEEKVREIASKQELQVAVSTADVKEPGRILCWDCLGSGKCIYCDTCGPCEFCKGAGELICEFCDKGHLECNECGGKTSDVRFITVKVTENVDYCLVCGQRRGTEGVVCPTCHGTGRAPCHMCRGAGRLTCTQCGGRAYDPCPSAGVDCPYPGCDGVRHKCGGCDENGLKDCNECEDGTEPCSVYCVHPGNFITTRTEEVEEEVDNPDFCTACQGQGGFLCNVCNGDYERSCELCSGTGITPCGMCPTEKGVCEMCHGSGFLDP